MKYLLILTLTVFAHQSAAQVIWPSTSAPCDTTLQACVSASAEGETIEIHTNDIIDETITAFNAQSLIAGVGYKPVFAADRNIEISGTATDNLTVTISGLTLIRGRITYTAFDFGGQNTTLNISNNLIRANLFNGHTIRINNQFNHNLNLNIEYNQITFFFNPSGIIENGAIAITNGSSIGSSSTGTITGRIYNNQIRTQNVGSIGIGLYEYAGNSSDLDISSNTLTGGEAVATYIEKAPQSLGNSRLDFAHNAIYNNQIDDNLNGFQANVSDGTLEVNAINNTVAGADMGFNFQPSFGGVLEINFYNNLVTQTRTPFIIRNPTITDGTANVTFNNDNNLFYANDSIDPDFVAGPNFSTANPMIKGLTDARLRPGSPAIETANSLYLFNVGNVPLVDADGLYRIKKGNPGTAGIAIDVGAYEAGDVRILDTKKGFASNINRIESNTVNAEQFAKIQFTQNLNPNGTNIINGIDSDINLGIYRFGAQWAIFSQDEISPMDIGTAFNVWNPAPSSRNYIHTAADAISASESFTELDASGLNDNPDAVLSVTQLWDGLYNDNPVGVFYNPLTSRWNIYNSNFVDMPWMAQFNVYHQARSSNAFIHRASDANIISDSTLIDHPLLNNSPCAQFQITYDSGIVFENRTGVFYNQTRGQWGIFNQGGETMPEGARFHVIVSAEQIAACNDIIFKDGFE